MSNISVSKRLITSTSLFLLSFSLNAAPVDFETNGESNLSLSHLYQQKLFQSNAIDSETDSENSLIGVVAIIGATLTLELISTDLKTNQLTEAALEELDEIFGDIEIDESNEVAQGINALTGEMNGLDSQVTSVIEGAIINWEHNDGEGGNTPAA